MGVKRTGRDKSPFMDRFVTIDELRRHYFEWGKTAKENITMLHAKINCGNSTYKPYVDLLLKTGYQEYVDSGGYDLLEDDVDILKTLIILIDPQRRDPYYAQAPWGANFDDPNNPNYWE